MADFELKTTIYDVPKLPEEVVRSEEFAALIKPLIDRFEADISKFIHEQAAIHCVASSVPETPKLTVVK